MNEPESIAISASADIEPQAQRRDWVTPEFDQVPLKDALALPFFKKFTFTDLTTLSS